MKETEKPRKIPRGIPKPDNGSMSNRNVEKKTEIPVKDKTEKQEKPTMQRERPIENVKPEKTSRQEKQNGKPEKERTDKDEETVNDSKVENKNKRVLKPSMRKNTFSGKSTLPKERYVFNDESKIM